MAYFFAVNNATKFSYNIFETMRRTMLNLKKLRILKSIFVNLTI